MAGKAAPEDALDNADGRHATQAVAQPLETTRELEPPQGREATDHTPPQRRPGAGRRATLADLLALTAYVAAALLVTARLWQSPSRHAVGYPKDQALFEWFLANAARSITHLENPLFSNRLDAPDGINLMANGSVLGMAVPMTPVTLLWGPSVAYVVMLTLIFIATAAAWYFVLSRHVVTSRLAAFVGGGFCAFAPGMLSQATGGHVHILAQFLVPVIAWRGFRLRESTRPVRDGAVLGLLVAYQAFIGEEVLFFTALACAVVVAWYAVARRREAVRQWRPFATGAGAAALVAGALLAYPLYVQFFGPRHYAGVPWLVDFNADIGAYPAFSRLTLAGDPGLRVNPLAQNLAEMNAFFGWPLLAVVVAIAVWLRGRLAVQITTGVIAVFAVLSLGREVDYWGRPTGVPGPYRYLAGLPLFDSVVPSRFGLVAAVAIGVLLALAVDHARWLRGPAVSGVSVARLVVIGTVLLALLPLAPRRLAATQVTPVPTFFTSGAWRQYVTGDQSVMPAAPNRDNEVSLMRWAAAQRNDFRVTHGYFIAPDPTSPENYGTMSRPVTPTTKLLLTALATGRPGVVGEADRAAARAELARREVAILVMSPQQVNGQAIRATLDALVGPGRLVDDLWVWDVHGYR
ncbi:MAG TPA: hypothetical protein VFB84_14080 [Micromonosporaceae bacterium]|nr:hypothetical protein [Micromonosporaceae bacterium]